MSSFNIQHDIQVPLKSATKLSLRSAGEDFSHQLKQRKNNCNLLKISKEIQFFKYNLLFLEWSFETMPVTV